MHTTSADGHMSSLASTTSRSARSRSSLYPSPRQAAEPEEVTCRCCPESISRIQTSSRAFREEMKASPLKRQDRLQDSRCFVSHG